MVYLNIQSLLNDGLIFLNDAGGLQCVATKYFYTFNDSEYDDNPLKTITGSISFSGILLPVDSKRGSSEAMLLEQGKIKNTDKILYCGSINTSGTEIKFLVGNNFYSLIDGGIITYEIAGVPIYNKMYLRNNLNGSQY